MPGQASLSVGVDEDHLEAFVRQRRAVEAAVECDECAVPIVRWELIPFVEMHPVRRPVRAEGHERLVESCTVDSLQTAHTPAVTSVLRRENLLLLEHRVEISGGASPPDRTARAARGR